MAESIVVNVRLPKVVVDWIDRMADEGFRTRSGMIQYILKSAARDYIKNELKK